MAQVTEERAEGTGEFEQTRIEFLMLADRAEAVNGKLYLMGGAWDQVNVIDFQQPVSISLAASVLVPWTETNEPRQFTMAVETADGQRVETVIEGMLTVGRPPTALPGQSLRSLIAVNGQWMLPGPGTYAIVMLLTGAEPKRVTLNALQAQGHPVPGPHSP